MHPTEPRDNKVLRAVRPWPGDLAHLAATEAFLHAAAVLVAVASPDGALAVARGIPAGVARAEGGPLHPRVPAVQGAPGRVRDEGVARVVVMPGLLGHVMMVVTTVVVPVLLNDIAMAVMRLRVPR